MVRHLAWLLILAGSLEARAAAPLDAPCRLDWRSTPLKQALEELTSRLGIPYRLDASVKGKMEVVAPISARRR